MTKKLQLGVSDQGPQRINKKGGAFLRRPLHVD
jgi:hypothetical protein